MLHNMELVYLCHLPKVARVFISITLIGMGRAEYQIFTWRRTLGTVGCRMPSGHDGNEYIIEL